jgi:hypothetical protein
MTDPDLPVACVGFRVSKLTCYHLAVTSKQSVRKGLVDNRDHEISVAGRWLHSPCQVIAAERGLAWRM